MSILFCFSFFSQEKASFHFTLWDKRYDDLKEFKKEYGHCDVPIDYPRLGIWVFNQRYTLSEMLQYRIDLLDSVGFIWNHNEELPPKMMETWNYVFDRYKQFIIDHDGVDFLHRDALLFDWAKRQRCEYRKYMSKDCTTKFMNRTLIEKLDEVGFDWNLDDDESVSWDAHYEVGGEWGNNHDTLFIFAHEFFFDNKCCFKLCESPSKSIATQAVQRRAWPRTSQA